MDGLFSSISVEVLWVSMSFPLLSVRAYFQRLRNPSFNSGKRGSYFENELFPQVGWQIAVDLIFGLTKLASGSTLEHGWNFEFLSVSQHWRSTHKQPYLSLWLRGRVKFRSLNSWSYVWIRSDDIRYQSTYYLSTSTSPSRFILLRTKGILVYHKL